MGEERGGCTAPGNCSSGACLPCPETAGSDCSVSLSPHNSQKGHTQSRRVSPCLAAVRARVLCWLAVSCFLIQFAPGRGGHSAATTRRGTLPTRATPSNRPATPSA